MASIVCAPRFLADVASGTIEHIVAAILNFLCAAAAVRGEERIADLIVGGHFTEVAPVDGARVVVLARGVFNTAIRNVCMNTSVSPSASVFGACVVVNAIVITLAAIRHLGSHTSVVGHIANFVGARLKVFALAVKSAAVGDLHIQTVTTVFVTNVSSAHIVIVTISVVLAAVRNRS